MKEHPSWLAKVYRALAESNPGRTEDVTRFTLQCIVAMFSEDIGLLPKEYFTTLLYRAAEEGGAAEMLAELFRQMATEGDDRQAGQPAFQLEKSFQNAGAQRSKYLRRYRSAGCQRSM
ncbi:MAG: hypothetical protein SangKO_056510 [Sandaracinaceae bacterium]